MSFELSTTYDAITCSSCGITYALTAKFRSDRLSDRKTWYCPNGHSQWYPPPKRSQEEILTAKLKSREQALERAYQQRAHAEHVARGHKAAHTRTKNRIKAGVCPCCNRHFQNLQRHMEGQHPDFQKTVDLS